ncbi:MAG TPA: SUMF1/EgtB/PvdO family nonheme iron enzyme, partial [Pirellulales bacterium]
MPGVRRIESFSQLTWSAVPACPYRGAAILCLVAALVIGNPLSTRAADAPKDPAKVENSEAKTQAEMKPYTDVVANTDTTFEMVPIPGGKFVMGSPNNEPNHKADEAPQHEVEISPFWMGKCEVTWDEYDVWTFTLDIQRRGLARVDATDLEKKADAVTRPTKPYTDMSFGMGKTGFPAISMTQLAAKTYCKWLSQKTGRYYRLP